MAGHQDTISRDLSWRSFMRRLLLKALRRKLAHLRPFPFGFYSAMQTDFASVNVRIASAPCSRPHPDCL